MAEPARGRLRIYLGAAPGVGKTYAMLSEGHRRAARGTDVVIAYVEHHARPNTMAMAVGLEAVPRAVVVHRDRPFEEMDLAAVLARKPQVALVDPELVKVAKSVKGTVDVLSWVGKVAKGLFWVIVTIAVAGALLYGTIVERAVPSSAAPTAPAK